MAKWKKQHYIPRFYLNLFVDKNKKSYEDDYVWVFTKPNRAARRKSPNNLCYQKKYYTLVIKDKKIESQLENIISKQQEFNKNKILCKTDEGVEFNLAEFLYSKYENKASFIMKELNEGNFALNDKQRYNLSTFISLLACRTPQFRDWLKHSANIAAKVAIADKINEYGAIDIYLKKHKCNFKSDSFLEFIRHMEVIPPKEIYIYGSIRSADELCKPIFARDWAFLIPESKDRCFITSDHPVVSILPENITPHIHPDLGIIETDFLFPISPKVCLRTSYSSRRVKKDGEIQTLKDNEIVSINRKIADFCKEHVFANTSSFVRLFY